MVEHRCGTVAILGRPNVGKSSLLNRLAGQHLSITAPRPQTTRYRVAAIRTEANAQTIYIDTPGFQLHQRSTFNRWLNRCVEDVLLHADVVLLVSEALKFTAEDEQVLRLLPAGRPAVMAINKIDTLRDKAELLPWLATLAQRSGCAELVPVSARNGDQIAELARTVIALLPPGAARYAADEITDRDERFFAAEFLREQLFQQLAQELPYATSVMIDSFREEGALRRIEATIYVERAKQRAMIIGREGARLKSIASAARRRMESLFGGKVFLQVWVKVNANWRTDERELQRLGYGHV